MRSLSVVFALVWTFFGCQTLPPPPTSFEVSETTIQVVGVLDGGLEKVPLAQMQAVPEGGAAHLYIFSLGGDPRVADAFLDAMEGKTTVCFATAASGPAFTILQACTYRLVDEKTLIGNSKFQFRGTSGDPVKDQEFRDMAERMAKRFADLEADRLDLSDEEYDAILSGGGFGWQGGQEILANKGADAQIELGCTAEANVSTLTRIVYPFGDGGPGIELKMTVCPVFRQLVSPDDIPADEVGEIIGIPLTPARKT